MDLNGVPQANGGTQISRLLGRISR